MGVIRPFDYHGVTRGADEISRYDGLAQSLVAAFRRSVEQYPDGEALVETGGGRKLTYREFWDEAARVAGGLKAQGIGAGDRVAIRLPNGVAWAVAFFGVQLAGAIVVPVNTRFSEAEVEYVIKDSASKFTFLPGEAFPDGAPYAYEEAGQKDVAAIFYTSGTTGFPKGAMTTHENFLANVESSSRVAPAPLDHNFRTLVSVPLFHVTGCNSQFLVANGFGGTTIIMPQFEPQAFLRAITEERVNSLTSVPAVYWIAMHQKNFGEIDTSGVTKVSYGGAPIAPDLVGKIMEAFPNARVGNGFGLTETAAMSTFLPHEYSMIRPETVGFAVPVIDVKLGEMEPHDDVGELLIRGQNVVKGYWNKVEATEDTFRDNWLRTGDLARIDAEGYVQIVDRKKDMVNRGGENVYCVEVENGLSGHPAVFEVAVMGVPDPVMGEKVGAVVVTKPGATLEVDDLLDYAVSVMADFKVPQYVVIRKEMLPRNPGGKILKKQLRETVVWGPSLKLRHAK
jgi:long-chain acyl-CoA synthetase